MKNKVPFLDTENNIVNYKIKAKHGSPTQSKLLNKISTCFSSKCL